MRSKLAILLVSLGMVGCWENPLIANPPCYDMVIHIDTLTWTVDSLTYTRSECPR